MYLRHAQCGWALLRVAICFLSPQSERGQWLPASFAVFKKGKNRAAAQSRIQLLGMRDTDGDVASTSGVLPGGTAPFSTLGTESYVIY